MVLDLVPVWTILIALAVFYFVVFDGFDLGVGILYGFARNEADRALIMTSIATIWDGNETWLIFGGLGRRDVRAGRRARQTHPGLYHRWPRLRRHLVRLGDAVRAPDRRRADVR